MTISAGLKNLRSAAQSDLEKVNAEYRNLILKLATRPPTISEENRSKALHKKSEKITAEIKNLDDVIAVRLEIESRWIVREKKLAEEAKQKASVGNRKLATKAAAKIIAAGKIMTEAFAEFEKLTSDVSRTRDLKSLIVDELSINGLAAFFPNHRVPSWSQVKQVGFAAALRNALDLENESLEEQINDGH